MIDVEIAVRNGAYAASFADLHGMIEEIALINPQIIEIVVDVQAVDVHARDMHVLDTVHRRSAPISLHAYIVQADLQTVRRAQHIARRARLSVRLFPRRVEARDA